MTSRLRTSAMLKSALAVLSLLVVSVSNATSVGAATGDFSQQQVDRFVNTVRTELELSKNWQSNSVNAAGSNFYCSPLVFGQGMRNGNQGIYTWFTCSAMHRLDSTRQRQNPPACTGFSSAVWIEPTATSITYVTVSAGADYIDFRNSAPADVQARMDATYSQVNTGKPRTLLARATYGSSKSASHSAHCN